MQNTKRIRDQLTHWENKATIKIIDTTEQSLHEVTTKVADWIKGNFMQTPLLDQKTIEDIKQRLVKTYNPREIYLLEPDKKDNIDVNIIVIVDEAGLQQRYALMAEGHKALIGIKIPKNILVYTKEEFEDYSSDQSTLSYLTKHYGRRIYAKA